jgi:hypothetical protein
MKPKNKKITAIVPPMEWNWTTRRHYDAKGKNGIGWCGGTWSVVHGCTHVSEGCDNCWSAALMVNHQKIESHAPLRLGYGERRPAAKGDPHEHRQQDQDDHGRH